MNYYDEIATGYEELHKEEQEAKINIIKKHLEIKNNNKLIDVGCGTGLTTLAWDCQLYGLDPSIKLLEKAKSKPESKNVNWINAPAEDIPFDDKFAFIEGFALVGIFFVTITLLFKVSAAPFHFWSPDVYEGSPLSSTIAFSILPKIALFTFLIRWVSVISGLFSSVQILLLASGLFSVFLGTFFAIKQRRVKKLVIYLL